MIFYKDNKIAILFGLGFNNWIIKSGFIIENHLCILKTKIALLSNLGGLLLVKAKL